jgi:hypothetical protein
MRGIERVVAAVLLAGAVAGAVALPRLAAGPAATAGIAKAAPQRVTTIVEAAPVPRRVAQKPKVVQLVIHRLVVPLPVSTHPHVTVHAQRVTRTPHVPAIAPDVVQAVPSAPAQQIAAAAARAPVAPAVTPTPALVPALGFGHGKGHGKGQDKAADATAPIVLPQVQVQVQVQAPPSADGNGSSHGNSNGKGNGHDK